MSQKEGGGNYEDLVRNSKAALDDDNVYVRNFDLVLNTCLQYDHLFIPEERAKIELFLK